MTVAELLAVLEHMPPELEVHVTSGYAKSCHVQRVERRGTWQTTLALAGSRYTVGDRVPGAVVLDGGVGWWRTPPPFEIRGPVRRRAELDRKLDALDLAAGP